ncbi:MULTISPECIES: aldehyde dehydrogenase family protein [Mesorhizobium]|uniref:aldehyde dehydrogenase family protein n=1 Tax=Mesorhizobium TaxID=68287 RepID=UPI002477FFC7|nr:MULTISPECIES: aldehyde dehydrogenase family protein [Mesorhizobium]
MKIANDSVDGLSAYVQSQDMEHARNVANRLRAGQLSINYQRDMFAPFDGYKQSGNGRETAEWFEETENPEDSSFQASGAQIRSYAGGRTPTSEPHAA